jgi:mRNA-degrading endonuclease RelE of RelBE toxin-antitoxin system
LTFKVLLHPNAARDLRKLNQIDKTKIKKTLETLAADPWKAGKPLHPSDFYSTRSEEYRAIYEINSQQNHVIVLFIGHRKKMYDNFAKLL